MKRTIVSGLAVLPALLALAGCNNFFHDLIPPDNNRIRAFSVPGQTGPAEIGETSIRVTLGPGADRGSLLPSVALPSRAAIFPVTLPYILRAFPSANLFREGMALFTGQDRAAYVINLIRESPDFVFPALDQALDFSGPVIFLVISGQGNIRQYTVTVDIDTGKNEFRSFGFAKFYNPDLVRGDAPGVVDNDAKTIEVTVWYPVENIASYTLIPSFETTGTTVRCNGAELASGESVLAFTKPGSGAELPQIQARVLTIERPGFDPADYTLSVRFREDPDTIRSITDFRFTANSNYGVRYTAVGEILDTGDTGAVTVRVHHTGAPPAALIPSFVSPGTVSVGGVVQNSGFNSHNFTRPVEYEVVSRNGMYRRTYQVRVEFVNEEDARPRMHSFGFYLADNPGLTANTGAVINHDAGVIVLEAVYGADPPPHSLVPRFSAGGTVSMGGIVQASGLGAQDFSRTVTYTVRDPGNPGLFREYRVETRFVRESLSLAEITGFWFFAEDNPGLCATVEAEIDQEAGTISAVLLFDGPGNGHRFLVSRWQARWTVEVGGITQAAGVGGVVFEGPVVYRAVSVDRAVYKDYTVTVREINARLYVDRDAAGDQSGVSWTDAFGSISEACEAAALLPEGLPAEIWIAEGTYRPSETGDRAAYFPIRGNTGYYGGFAGTETAKDQRVPGSHAVIISGDLGNGDYAEHFFMNPDLEGRNAAFGELAFTKARALTGTYREGPAVRISNAGAVTINNVKFENLRAGSDGGAVYVYDTVAVAITGCGFTDIQAENGAGGAVYANGSGGSVSITDCDFTETTAAGHGGAIYASGSINITGCDFEEIQAGGAGGAVWASTDSGGSVTITDCDFTDTTVGSNGGAVYAESGSGGSVIITECDFTNTRPTGTYSFGGAVYASTGSDGSISIRDCGFTGTRSTGGGGAVYAIGPSISTGFSCIINITDCDFTDTQAMSNGGAICTAAYNGSVNITGCDFTDTKSEREGVSSLTDGGAVWAVTSGSGGSISITDCAFIDTQAMRTGGAVYAAAVLDGSSISITDCAFTDTQAMSTGGAIAINASSSSGGSVIITGCDFSYTQAAGTGGAVYASGISSGSLTLTDCDFSYTQAESSGGAVYAIGGSGFSVTLRDCGFENTRSGINGGAICTAGSTGSLTLTDCDFSYTQAAGAGGAVDAYSRYGVTITGCNFTNTYAEGPGGGIYATATIDGVTIKDCDFSYTQARTGGAVFFHSGAVSGVAVTIMDCSINGAVSSLYGGAIGNGGPSSYTTLTRVSFTGCSAPQGNLLYGFNSMVYSVGPGCSVEGTEITISTWLLFMSPVWVYLTDGATIVPGL
jgi:hypothetical protein